MTIDPKEYAKVHMWLRYYHGVATQCEATDCKRVSMNYQWALKRGYQYEKNRENFWQLCVSCHKMYDITPETRLKFRARLLGKPGLKRKRVAAFKGSFQREYPSLMHAAEDLKVCRTGISNALTGRAKTAGGYTFTYAN